MQMPGRTFQGSDDYRYGFNGMEGDDEVKGNGNSYDFGARMYDPRVGRWLSLDPLATKYPSQSPYNFVVNNPIIYVDKDGKENVIYLIDMRLTDPKLSKVDRENILAELHEIASATNSGFEEKGLTPRVVVVEEIPDAQDLDDSDVLATIGSAESLYEFDMEENGYDLVGIPGMGLERTTSKGAAKPDGGEEKGNRVAFRAEAIDAYAGYFNLDRISLIAWVIQHASIHTAGLHDSDPESGEFPNMITDGQYGADNPEKFQEYKDKVTPEIRGAMKNKYTNNPAKDNAKKNKKAREEKEKNKKAVPSKGAGMRDY